MNNGFDYLMKQPTRKTNWKSNTNAKKNHVNKDLQKGKQGKIISYLNKYYEVATSQLSSTNNIVYVLFNIENKNDHKILDYDDKNIHFLSNDECNKIEKVITFVEKYNACIRTLNSKRDEDNEFLETDIHFVLKIIDKKRCGITMTQLDNIMRHLKVSHEYSFQIYNITSNPFSFIQADVQIISYEKAEKIFQLYDIDIPFNIKCQKWSYDFIRVFNCFYVDSRKFWDHFQHYCKENSKNYKEYCSIVNEVLIDKMIDGRNYKTTTYLYELEKMMGDMMMNLYHDKKYNISETLIREKITLFEKQESIILEKEQVQAIIDSIIYKFNCITGYPGTGKSTIVKCILFVFKCLSPLPSVCSKQKKIMETEAETETETETEIEADTDNECEDEIERKVYIKDHCKFIQANNISLLAPTGLAFLGLKKKCESVEKNEYFNKKISGTCHRAIYKFFVDMEKKDFPTLLIMDEVSMLDIFLFHKLLKFCQLFNCRLLLCGDENQLPSIGPGCVLKNIIQSTLFNHNSLSEIKRQKSDGVLVSNIKKMNESKITTIDFTDDSMLFLNIQNFAEEESAIRRLIVDHQLNDNNTKFLTYFNKKTYKFNVSDLNKTIQSLFNSDLQNREIPPNSRYQAEKYTFKENDMIVRIVNSYAKGDDIRANGEMAKINSFDYKTNKVSISYLEDGTEMKISKNELYEDFELAYALTIHKSQGSQFDNIVIFIDVNQNSWDKTALYTAISRAKQKCIIVGKYEDFLKIQSNRRNLDDKISLFLREFNEYEIQ